MLTLLTIYSDWAIAVLRIVAAIVILAHGWPKFKALKATQKGFDKMGFKPGWLWGTVAAIVEVGGAVLLIAGLFVQLVAAVLAVQFLVAFLYHLKNRDELVHNSEAALLLSAISLALATLGGGAWALDNIVRFLL